MMLVVWVCYESCIGRHAFYLLGIYFSNNYADINECSTNNGGCAQTCTNNAGSFQCSCGSGYSLASNGMSCIDIDECQVNNGNCQQSCQNINGGSTCSCFSGYTLNNDGRTCSGMLLFLLRITRA